jgi:hypothetical protein
MSQNSDFLTAIEDYGRFTHTRKPYYHKKNTRNKDLANLDIKRNAPPVEFDVFINGFIFCPINQSHTPTNANFDDFNQLAPLDYDDSESDVNFTNSSLVTDSIANFEAGVKQLAHEYQPILEVPDQLEEFPAQHTEFKHWMSFTQNQRTIIDDALKLISSEKYQTAKNSFLQTFSRLSLPPSFMNGSFNHLDHEDRSYLSKILSFDDRYLTPPPKFKVKIAYIPSGGGKTTMLKYSLNRSRFFDVDDLVLWFYSKFKFILECKSRMTESGCLMSKWFKYHLHDSATKLSGKILLFNHPNQLPNYFRRHEVIILPCVPNFGLRYFDENYISLLAVAGKKVVLTDYDSYELVIQKILQFEEVNTSVNSIVEGFPE